MKKNEIILDDGGMEMSRFALLFPGQGSQAVGMGRDFFESSTFAQELFAQANETLGFQLSQLCFEGPEEKLRMTRFTQPALLTVSTVAYGLLGKVPSIAAGHSLGEYSALVAAGSLRFEDALLLVHKRGQYMQEAVPLGDGAMAAVLGMDYEKINKVLKSVKRGVVEIANWNSKEQVVISGDKETVLEALDLLNPPKSVLLPVSAPFHCRLMKPAEEKLSYELDYVEFRDLKFPVVTNVDAQIIRKGNEAREALKRQVSRPVLWYKSMSLMEREGICVFVELGSGKILSGLVKRIGREWTSPPEVLNIEDWNTLDKARKILSGIL